MDPFSLDHIFPLAQMAPAICAAACSKAARLLLAARSSGISHRSLSARVFPVPNGQTQRSSFSLPLRCQRTAQRVRTSPSPLETLRGILHACSARRRSPLVGLVRVELTTSRLSGVRSNHLSYRPKCWRVTAAVPASERTWRSAHIQKREESGGESG